jgi:hypothetical protein
VEQASRLLNLASRQISRGDTACGLAVVGKIIVVANGFRRDAGNNRPEACATNNRVPLRVKLARAIKTIEYATQHHIALIQLQDESTCWIRKSLSVQPILPSGKVVGWLYSGLSVSLVSFDEGRSM